MADRNCSIAGCTRMVFARGWCAAHYQRWKRHGDPESGGAARHVQPATCTETGCGKPTEARGLCIAHYLRTRRATDAEFTARQRAYDLAYAAANPQVVFERKRAWREANADHVAQLGAKWRNENRAETAAYKFRQRRRAAGLSDDVVELVDPAVVYERDHGVCQLCFELVDTDLQMPDPFAATLDHRIPVIDPRSTHTYANTQLAHWACNRRKNRKVPLDVGELV